MMTFKMYDLYTSGVARLLARLSRHCTVVLTSGMKVEFEKGFKGRGIASYEGSMSKTEELEYIHAMMLMGI